jgi:hypothetical protein
MVEGHGMQGHVVKEQMLPVARPSKVLAHFKSHWSLNKGCPFVMTSISWHRHVLSFTPRGLFEHFYSLKNKLDTTLDLVCSQWTFSVLAEIMTI